MHEKPKNIEELTELRDWLKGVPEQLAVQQVRQALLWTGTSREVRRKFVNVMCGVSEAELLFFYLHVFACNATRFLALYFYNS